VSTNSVARMFAWLDAHRLSAGPEADGDQRVDWLGTIPYLILHLSVFAVFFVGVSWFAIGLMIVSYMIRVFGITVGYHRYLSHRAFKVRNRLVQFLLIYCGSAAVQRGPLWWAAHHRDHHKHSDTDEDHHSPVTKSFLWSHMLWFLTHGNHRTRVENIQDFAKYPEIRLLDRYELIAPVTYGFLIFLSGVAANALFPSWGTSGMQALVWGFFVSTILVHHATFSINSLVHIFGTRRFETSDNSRNNGWLCLFTFGESWHNNHHRFPGSARLGFYWWEVDLGYYCLKAMQALGLAHDLRPVPAKVMAEARGSTATA
jgi:stearoyl-CoA desaturase (delta-9 desaturase)